MTSFPDSERGSVILAVEKCIEVIVFFIGRNFIYQFIREPFPPVFTIKRAKSSIFTVRHLRHLRTQRKCSRERVSEGSGFVISGMLSTVLLLC